MPPLLEKSTNASGRKRKPRIESDDAIMEGGAAEWHAAATLLKKPKIGPMAPLESRPDREGMLDEIDPRGCGLQRSGDESNDLTQPLSAPRPMAARTKWTADPRKLPPKKKGKKLKYYGVLFGKTPGIYYSWDEAEPQVKGVTRAVFISSTEAQEIEQFMNHRPVDCRWATCAKRCCELPPFPIATTKNTPQVAPHSESEVRSTTASRAQDTLALNHAVSSTLDKHSKTSLATADRSLPTSEVTSKNVCNCGNPQYDNEATVQCANIPYCAVGTYHRKCVGLATRKETAGWRCVDCRPLPSSLQSSSQLSSVSRPSLPASDHDVSQHLDQLTTTAVNPLISAEPEPPLHPEQEAVVQAIMQGYNVFYTGSAGVGKSTVLKNFVKRLERQNKKIDIVAPSGIAALNVGGMTTYSYAGWTPDSFKEPLEKIIAAAHGKKVRKRLCKTDVLVMDEISMVERDMFIRLDQVMREARHGWKDFDNPHGRSQSPHDRMRPFGGVQLIVTGDFCQLPPVKPFRFCLHCGGDELPGYDKNDGRPLTCRRCKRTYEDKDKWAFSCKEWDHCEFSYFELKHVHRQSDLEFINILQKCRYDRELLPSEKALLLKPKADPLGAVKLLPMRRQVENENASKFKLLQGRIRAYDCLDIFSWRNRDEPELQKKGRPRDQSVPDGPLEALKDHRYEEKIELRVGMLVILLCNLSFPDGLVNGSQGKIIGFEPYDPKEPVVAKARDTSPPRSGKDRKENTLHMERTEFQEAQIRKFITKSESQEWPIVQFSNGLIRSIYASCPVNEVGIERPYSLLARTQIPLLAAWAITIHKSQGLSLDKVVVNLQNTFEREQIYVALSRARSLNGLRVVALPDDRNRGRNREVAEFLMKHFESAQ